MEPKTRSRLLLGLSTAVLLVVGLELSLHADALSVWSDEMWSIFHGGKTVAQILRERDLLWPFGYFLLLHVWTQVTGSSNDFVMHALGVFMGLLEAACLLRVGRIWRMPLAGLLAALAFGTSSYAMYFALELRGYALMLLLESAFILVYLRWLKRPSLRRSVVLLPVMIAMLYTHFILGLVIAAATLHLLLSRPRMVGRWGVLTAIAGIAFLPLLPQLSRGFELATAAGQSGPLPPLMPLGLGTLYRAYSAHWDLWFAIVLACCAVGWFWAVRRLEWQTTAWLLVWAVGIPISAYALRQHIALLSARYLVFTMPAAMLLLGVGLSALPRPWIGVGVLAVLALAPWQPFDFRPSYADSPPLRDFMREMASDFRPGDRLVPDPFLAPLATSLEWSYYKSVYFPQGDFRLTEPGAATERRVWYLYRQGQQDIGVQVSVSGGRVQRTSWGPWYLHAALFEAPPTDLGTPFGQALRFLGADVDQLPEVHAGDILPVQLWWTTDMPTSTDFSVSLELCDSTGRVVARTVGPPVGPEGAPLPSLLPPGEILLDTRRVQVPYHLDDGVYTLQLAVTLRGESIPLPPGNDATSDHRLLIDRLHLASFAAW
jgi:hypothetical protein